MFWGASMVTLRPRSVLNFSTIGVRARPRSLSIQTKSSPLVHANSFGVTKQRANNINNKRLIEGRGKMFKAWSYLIPPESRSQAAKEFKKFSSRNNRPVGSRRVASKRYRRDASGISRSNASVRARSRRAAPSGLHTTKRKSQSNPRVVSCLWRVLLGDSHRPLNFGGESNRQSSVR